MQIQSGRHTHKLLVMCRFGYNIDAALGLWLQLINVDFFLIAMILLLIKVASYTQALYIQYYNDSALNMFRPNLFGLFLVKRENNAVPKFFKIIVIVKYVSA